MKGTVDGLTDLLSLSPEAAGFDPIAETVTTGSRSGDYPGGDETDVTLLSDRESGRVLGDSTVGRDWAPIRIDTLATAIEVCRHARPEYSTGSVKPTSSPRPWSAIDRRSLRGSFWPSISVSTTSQSSTFSRSEISPRFK